MKRMQMFTLLTAMSLLIAASGTVMGQAVLGPGFTYQGQLMDGGQPANGTYDMEFRLYGFDIGGSQIGSTVFANGIELEDGRFTVELDFGFDVFNGDERWLQIEIDNTVLSPRQAITATPYAIHTRGIHVTDNEQVGIGINNPERVLHTVGDAVLFERDVNDAAVLLRNTSDGEINAKFGLHATGLNDGYSYISDANFNPLLYLSNGFVGVGRDFPLANTEVFGIHDNTTGFAGMIVGTDQGGSPYYGYSSDGGQAEVHHYFDSDTGFWHLWNGDERISVSDNGYVGIGRSTPIDSTSRLDVESPAGNNQYGGMQVNTAGLQGLPYYAYATDGSTKAFTYYNGGTDTWLLEVGGLERVVVKGATGRVGISTFDPQFLLHVNGSCGKPGGGSWSNASDRRLKKNIEDLDGSLEKLMKLRGVTFEYKDPQAIQEFKGERVGVIAQEVEKVFPDWIDKREDGYKAVTFRGFEALAVEALRELRSEKDEQIQSLKKEKDEQVQTLEQENDDLRQRLEALEAAVLSLMEKP